MQALKKALRGAKKPGAALAILNRQDYNAKASICKVNEMY